MRDKYFLDSNILIYLNDEALTPKKEKALELIDEHPIISPQIVFECLNVCVKKLRFSKSKAEKFIEEILQVSVLVNEDEAVVRKALQLYHKHSLQVFDSKIIATALLSGCNILYSEDLQHKQVFERKLKIINPFL